MQETTTDETKKDIDTTTTVTTEVLGETGIEIAETEVSKEVLDITPSTEIVDVEITKTEVVETTVPTE
jgi:hypothetical protein